MLKSRKVEVLLQDWKPGRRSIALYWYSTESTTQSSTAQTWPPLDNLARGVKTGNFDRHIAASVGKQGSKQPQFSVCVLMEP